MSAERLREAARLMRERAEAASPSPWEHAHSDMCRNQIEAGDMDMPVASTWAADGIPDNDYVREESNAAHIASWHPVVALAVADWLDHTAEVEEHSHRELGHGIANGRMARALAVADAYLGDQR